MPAPRALTEEQDEQIRAAYLDGTPTSVLAREYEVSIPTIRNRIKGLRRPDRPEKTPAASPPARPRQPLEHPAVIATRRTRGRVAEQHTCTDVLCGQPIPVSDAPTHDIVIATRTPVPARRQFCSWHCASRHCIRRELDGAA